MRRHGWQLPYHPLQVVAVSVFLALAFAFYVFFAPFVGRNVFQYVVIGLYTPLVLCVFFLYIWCAAANPADPGVFKSKKYLSLYGSGKHRHLKECRKGSSDVRLQLEGTGEKQEHEVAASSEMSMTQYKDNIPSCMSSTFSAFLLLFYPLSFVLSCCQSHEWSSEQQATEEGMFFCSLCEVQVLKYSKHCRVCDKCVDGFDHHCRWLNNCIGRRNYGRFFILMSTALILLILQSATGVLVLVLCFVERKEFCLQIVSKLGSSFSVVPFVIVVASCTILAMVASLPIAQLLFFHILLIKKASSDTFPFCLILLLTESCKKSYVKLKHHNDNLMQGISTYDYIIALREQEQDDLSGQQSPQMSRVSSYTGLSSTSSFGPLRRGSWCTPPRLFLEDQFDVIPSEAASSHNSAMKRKEDEGKRKKGSGAVQISPWALARLNAEEVSRVAAEARKKSKVLLPIRKDDYSRDHETDSSYGGMSNGRIDLGTDSKRRTNRRGRQPSDLSLKPVAKISTDVIDSTSRDMAPEALSNLAPLQLEALSAFHPSRAASCVNAGGSSPDSSLDSPDLHLYRVSAVSSSGAEDLQLTALTAPGSTPQQGIQLSRSTSDGYEASGGEDSDRIPSRIVHRSSNWASIILNSDQSASSSGILVPKNRLS
ncbi:Metal ion binding protein [Zea mays]|uniref:S-acyltransferase n=1 Tax=Zea mays TaxID=4577 RepID=A0A1D6F083_MAIZE|nr:Metal ion binding protein [Zea mays]